MVIEQALTEGTRIIRESGAGETPLLDASLLLCHTLDITRVQLYTRGKETLSPDQKRRFHSLVEKRKNHVPVAYLTNTREFYNRDFYINEDVLIPRGDTEILVETSLELLDKAGNRDRTVLDMCTGSGCVGITIALENSDSWVTLSDISTKALKVAQTNISRLKASNATCIESDLFESMKERRFSLICANPPYIAPQWYEQCSLQVKREPQLALIDDSPDGLDIIRKIIRQSPLHLHTNGYLVIECDYRQIGEAMRLLREEGFCEITAHRDLGDRQRVVSGRYSCTRN